MFHSRIRVKPEGVRYNSRKHKLRHPNPFVFRKIVLKELMRLLDLQLKTNDIENHEISLC